MCGLLLESAETPHALIRSLTAVNMPPACNILHEDWEPYYEAHPHLGILFDGGIKKTAEYGNYGWHMP